MGDSMSKRTVTVTVRDEELCEVEVKSCTYSGDELTSAEQEAILFLKSIEKDPLDE